MKMGTRHLAAFEPGILVSDAGKHGLTFQNVPAPSLFWGREKTLQKIQRGWAIHAKRDRAHYQRSHGPARPGQIGGTSWPSVYRGWGTPQTRRERPAFCQHKIHGNSRGST